VLWSIAVGTKVCLLSVAMSGQQLTATPLTLHTCRLTGAMWRKEGEMNWSDRSLLMCTAGKPLYVPSRLT